MADTQPPAGTDPGTTRRKRLLVIGSVLALIGVGWGAHKFLSNGALVSTDDAYVNGHVVAVTPQVAGTVRAILADDTDRIRAGTRLVEPPRVYRRVFGSIVRLFFYHRSGLYRRSPLLRSA
ncbi:HlyD family secretion protein [Gluconacetobacter dulcium]|uniref:hypothetical protein n=1 Tax=Gluconacetobacter dulcium TaxID=2729096 RepID=UPI001601C732|nr:hypothetical protein [Gluconacetobacter dulcium]